MKEKIKVLAITGPTATGKTKYAIELAQKLGGEIISADSRMIYKYFDIATAKPTVQEREGVQHHLIDIIEPEENFSVANFIDYSSDLIKEISSRGKVPIIAGGTGLYFKVLSENYKLPRVPANSDLRKELQEYAEKYGNEKLHERLQNLDEKTARTIHPNNVVRVIRTIEIINAINMPLSEYSRKNDEGEFDIEFTGLILKDREVLYKRINERVDLMLEKGLIKEAQELFAKYGKINSLMNTIGYQELIPYFENDAQLQSCIDLIKQNTRNYAKRQLSLLRPLKTIKWQEV